MADRRMPADATPSDDVEMVGTDLHLGGNGLGNEHAESNGYAHNEQVAASAQLPDQPNIPNLPNNANHTTPTPVKSDPDPDELQSNSSPQTQTVKMRPASKKKGTAAKKGPRKGGKISKSKLNSKKDNAANGLAADSSDDETDNGPYCICRGPDDHRWMISCDVCEDWFHGECVDLDKDVGEKLVERFVCPKCTDGKQNYTKYKKLCSLPGCKNAARLYTRTLKERSVFCCNDHCDAWWASIINTLPTKAATEKAIEVLTQEDFVALLISTTEQGGWKLGDKPFGMFILVLVILSSWKSDADQFHQAT